MTPPPQTRRLADTLALGAAALAVYVAFGQETFYGPDGRHLLKMLLSGMQAHPNHFFYVPVLRALHEPAAAVGLSPYELALLLSQAGTALAVALFHRASLRLGLARGQAFATAALVACAPAVLFFATVVELHGFFLPFAGAAALAAARLAVRPTLAAGVVLGLATGLAVGAHATAHLLPLAFLPLAFRDGQRPVRPALSALAAHAATAAALPLVLRALGLKVHGGSALTYVLAIVEVQGLPLDALAALPWRDWLAPYAPLSVLACLRWRGARAETLGFLGAVLAYLFATFVLMGRGTENGSYLLPLAWPAAVLTVRGTRRWAWPVAATLGFALGARWVVTHDQPEFGRAFAAATRALHRESPAIFFAAQHREFDAFFIHAPELRWKDPLDDAALPPDRIAGLVPLLESWVRSQRASGTTVFLTEGYFEYLAAPSLGDHPETGPVLARAWRETFALVPVERGVFRGFRVDLR